MKLVGVVGVGVSDLELVDTDTMDTNLQQSGDPVITQLSAEVIIHFHIMIIFKSIIYYVAINTDRSVF